MSIWTKLSTKSERHAKEMATPYDSHVAKGGGSNLSVNSILQSQIKFKYTIKHALLTLQLWFRRKRLVDLNEWDEATAKVEPNRAGVSR